MKRIAAITTLLLLASVAQAETTGAAAETVGQAAQTWQNMPPAAQEAAKAQAKSEAQQYQENWQQLTPEEQAAKKEGWKSEAQSRAAASGMQRPMRMGTMSGGMAARRR